MKRNHYSVSYLLPYGHGLSPYVFAATPAAARKEVLRSQPDATGLVITLIGKVSS